MHYINVHNKSKHPQTFEVHGWNNNHNITVKPGATHAIAAPDHTSGAIIALHDGHEGEQAEITKDGFMGNDFIDLSNIMGAGGNMIVQQVGDPSTRKGDPLFMQHMNKAWHDADAATKKSLQHCVFLNKEGNVIRIGSIKDNPGLEKLVRTFANGKTYIGVGAWGGSPGNKNDNDQSSAAHGDKDILVVYNDGDATPTQPPHLAHRVQAKLVEHEEGPQPFEPTSTSKPGAGFPAQNLATIQGVATNGHESADAPSESADTHPEQHSEHSEDKKEPEKEDDAHSGDADADVTAADADRHDEAHPAKQRTAINAAISGPGVMLYNRSSKPETYFFYDNYWNGNGTAGANFDHPLKSIRLAARMCKFVSLPESFKGRVQRGTLQPATWVEFQVKASNDGAAHGDISLEQGCDGAATIASTDGSRRSNGFTKDIIKNAPAAAVVMRVEHDGSKTKCLASTMGNWSAPPNHAAADYEKRVVGQKKAYITGGTGTDDVASHNMCLRVDFY